MTEKMRWQCVNIIPTITVTDLENAVAFYVKLGFKESWRYPYEKMARATHIGMKFDSARIMLALVPAKKSIDRQHISLIMKNVQAYHAHVQKRFRDGVSELLAMEYGMREFSVVDPWGHQVIFGEEC